MFLLALLAFMPKLILGFSIAQLIWSDERLTSLLLKLFLSIPLGMGTASILLFFWKWAGLDHQGYTVVELVVTALFFIGMIFARKDAFRNIEFDVELSQIKQNKIILLVVTLAAVVSSAVFSRLRWRFRMDVRMYGAIGIWSHAFFIIRMIFPDLSNILPSAPFPVIHLCLDWTSPMDGFS